MVSGIEGALHRFLRPFLKTLNPINLAVVSLTDDIACCLQITPTIILVDINKRAAVFHGTSRAESVAGAYENEFVWVIYMNEDGTKAVRIEEFVDSAKTREQLEELQEVLADGRAREK